MIFEDLWFWGYFNQEVESSETSNRKKQKNRKFKFNLDKILADPFYPSEKLKLEIEGKSTTFRKLIKGIS